MKFPKSIEQYYLDVEKIKKYGGTDNELSIKVAFKKLVDVYVKSQSLLLIDELSYKTEDGKLIYPDGTLKDSIRLNRGFWESKDIYDDIDKEIKNKIAKGYPTSNIIFENSEVLVLYQNGEEKDRCNFSDDDDLDRILMSFVRFRPREIIEFYDAIERFKEEIPSILEVLNEDIKERMKIDKKFKKNIDDFLLKCKDAINNNIIFGDVREMIIQHILTQDMFTSVFDDSDFHRSNTIAKEIQKLVELLWDREKRKNLLSKIEDYYKVIKRTASNVENYKEKQQLLKILYENFYKSYNPAAADRLGIFFTPNEIVDFIVDGVKYFLDKKFNRVLSSDNIKILDPATGTGTFIIEILENIPNNKLEKKYKNEIFCNEVAILPYYIANLNIEYTFYNKLNKTKYLEFNNICFVDTLENMGFSSKNKQTRLFDLGDENLERIKKQNKQEISVIIGNPPYNANQLNFNNFNQNKEYPDIDKRISETYLKESSATKTKLYDMYTRFIRWSTDRLGDKGIIAFVSNNSFLEASSYDGFRKSIAADFEEMWVINLKGNARTSGERRKKEGGNIFDNKIKVGIAIYFLIRNQTKNEPKKDFNLYYYEIDDYMHADEKKAFLTEHPLEKLKSDFENIRLEDKRHWFVFLENEYDSFIKLAKDSKSDDELSVFKFRKPGVSTNRDQWVYDFNIKLLAKKIKFFIKKYQATLKKKKKERVGEDKIDEILDQSIKWSQTLEKKLLKNVQINSFDEKYITDIFLHPFIIKKYYFDKNLSDRLTRYHFLFFGENLNKDNKCIIISKGTDIKPFGVFCSRKIIDLHFIGDSQIIPLKYYDDKAKRFINSVTQGGLKHFKTIYKDTNITSENILFYVYAVLNDPFYKEKYKDNLKISYPRIPLYQNFKAWMKQGKTLLNLHLNYDTIEPHKSISIVTKENLQNKEPTLLLQWDKKNHSIKIDDFTVVIGIPQEVKEYKVFGESNFIDYICDYYKDVSVRSTKMGGETFDEVETFEKQYDFTKYREDVIDLIGKSIEVSIQSLVIEKNLENLDHTIIWIQE